jgi:hypothetical protein
VQAFVQQGSSLYIGGSFSNAGGVPCNYIAKWDGTNFSALGAGTNAPVFALETNGTDLYAGGYFNMAGGAPANFVAMWDGTNWNPMGNGFDAWVLDLQWDGSQLWAGGTFTKSGVLDMVRVARWNGTDWQPVGSGLRNGLLWPVLFVYDIEQDGDDVFMGGSFSTAGVHPSYGIARWNVNLTDVEDEKIEIPTDFMLSQNYPNPFNPSTTIDFHIMEPGQVTLTIYNALGKEVAVAADDYYSAGSHSVYFNASDLPSGVYFYRIETGSFAETKKMTLLK